MVTNGSIAPSYRPRIGLAGARPLAERFEETRALALQEIPPDDPDRGVINAMCSEQSIDLINDAIARSRARRLKPISPELRAAWREYSGLRQQYNNFVRRITTTQQRWLWRAKTDWRHQLLRSIKQDHFFELKPLPGWEPKDLPDVLSTRQASKALHSPIPILTTVAMVDAGLAKKAGTEIIVQDVDEERQVRILLGLDEPSRAPAVINIPIAEAEAPKPNRRRRRIA